MTDINPFILSRREALDKINRLSPRQYTALYLLIMGNSYQQTALIMGIHYKTLASYLMTAKCKLDAQTIAQAAAVMIVSRKARIKPTE